MKTIFKSNLMNPTKIKLSILILTYNEERYIKDLLEKIQFADEILVVDSYSTDRTVAIVKSFASVKLIQNKFKNYADQRNFAIANSKNDWVLFLDADERLTPKLELEIKSLFNSTMDYVAYSMPRVFMFKDKAMHFTGTQNDLVLRLFNKTYCTYLSDKLVHEKLEVNGKSSILQNKMIHYTYYDYQIFKKKVIKYGILKAEEKNIKGKKYSFMMHIFHPIFTFISYYFLKLGLLDGYRGIVLSYLFSFSVYARYEELKRLQS
jgi:glycosyltransferase involved in cell wall biosynthesis